MTRSSSSGADVDRNRSRLENDGSLDRVTVRAPDEQLAAIDSLVDAGRYHNRSEAIRAGIRQVIERHERDVDLETG